MNYVPIITKVVTAWIEKREASVDMVCVSLFHYHDRLYTVEIETTEREKIKTEFTQSELDDAYAMDQSIKPGMLKQFIRAKLNAAQREGQA